MQPRWLIFTTTAAVVLAFLVVMLGAYTRLTHAGLGCPDWPGCYGHMIVPASGSELTVAQNHYPLIPLEKRKAWTEMSHRYLAGTLAVLVFVIGAGLLWQGRAASTIKLAVVLMGLILFQAALGMWTVTMKLLPLVVMGHLLGGILVFSCLCLLRLQMSGIPAAQDNAWQKWVLLAVVVVFGQICLGGWVSANYAGTACIGFPQCNGHWMPPSDLTGFRLFSPLGPNYQSGLLDNSARATIQFVHRLGALITLVVVGSLSFLLFRRANSLFVRFTAIVALLLLTAQLFLGIINVLYLLPLSIAVAHNGGAALLMAVMIMMAYLTRAGGCNDR